MSLVKIKWLVRAFSVRASDGSKLRYGCVGTVEEATISTCTPGEHYEEVTKPKPKAAAKPKPKADPKAETPIEES
jgi:hypothetical protein